MYRDAIPVEFGLLGATELAAGDATPTLCSRGARFITHAPVHGGCHADLDGCDVACARGWSVSELVQGGSGAAARAGWLPHKAAVITDLLRC